MNSTFLDFFLEGYQPTKKISFLGGPAHFVTYGGDGLVDYNNALTSMASALKTIVQQASYIQSKE
jgi:hypothetical protein